MIYLILLLRKGKKVVNIDDDLELTGSSLILTKKFGGPTKWMFSVGMGNFDDGPFKFNIMKISLRITFIIMDSFQR